MRFAFGFCIIAIFISSSPPFKTEVFDPSINGLPTPPNGVHLFDNVFIEDSEIMNAHYLEFLHHIAQDSSLELAKKLYPDTNIFGVKHRDAFINSFTPFYSNNSANLQYLRKMHHDESIEKGKHVFHWYNYFSFEGTKYYPVVGITYEQALKYCQWRSAYVTNEFQKEITKNKKYPTLKYKKVIFTFRLPTEKEWEFAASGGNNPSIYAYGYKSITQKPFKIYKPKYLIKHIDTLVTKKQLQKDIETYLQKDILNFNCIDKIKPYFEDQELEPEFAYDNRPNDYGLFNMIGNVSEMINVNGTSKGGSYLDSLKHITIKDKKNYLGAQKWLGFRPVCEVKIITLDK
ncbi:MAG: SUMF1/EgtB/PvdO family nonheme iron enzyme [Bacteroidota bacterium]|nr:SUMF1/EgtB/PvdO family nonheme iron enzyme [Bacteroidota bacterium]